MTLGSWFQGRYAEGAWCVLRTGLSSVLGNVGYQGTLVIEDGLVSGTLRGTETISQLYALGGDLAIADDDGDGLADQVRSAEGFGGLLFLPPLPDPLAPRVSASFVGTRQ